MKYSKEESFHTMVTMEALKVNIFMWEIRKRSLEMNPSVLTCIRIASTLYVLKIPKGFLFQLYLVLIDSH